MVLGPKVEGHLNLNVLAFLLVGKDLAVAVRIADLKQVEAQLTLIAGLQQGPFR